MVGGIEYQTKREYVRAAKCRPCCDCGNQFHPSAMEFDHARGDKKFELSYYSHPLADLIEEVAKCDVVCACCHRVRTHNRALPPGRALAPCGPITKEPNVAA